MTQTQEMKWVEEAAQPAIMPQPAPTPMIAGRVNLYRLSWVRPLLERRWPQFILRSFTLIGFAFILATALTGTPVGSHNFAIIMVWIAWWTTLKLGFIPLGGRSWCSICPIPLVGDWLQHGGILVNGKHSNGFNLRWPKSMRSSWLQSAGFLLIGLFSAVTLTNPRVTGWVLLALLVSASVLSLVFEHRAFCSYICPIGGFSGMYAKAAPMELRVVDKIICVEHTDKTCYHACPWGLYPLAFKDSSACGLCLECLRVCPKDNLALNIRPYGNDLTATHRSYHLDEAFLALVMLGSALVFSAVFVGPWGWLKTAAYAVGSSAWLAYSAGFLIVCTLILPGMFTLSVWLWKRLNHADLPLKQLIASHSRGVLPLGLLVWVAFTISFALPKLNLILGVLNDPFGWGWHLLGFITTPKLVNVYGVSIFLQIILLLIGGFWSASVTRKVSQYTGETKFINNIPLLAFYLLYSSVMLWLLIG